MIAAAIVLSSQRPAPHFPHSSAGDLWLSIVCFVGVAVFGAIPGIGLAMCSSQSLEFLSGQLTVSHYACSVKMTDDPELFRQSSAIRMRRTRTRTADVPFVQMHRCSSQSGSIPPAPVLEDRGGATPTPVRLIIVSPQPITDINIISTTCCTRFYPGPAHMGHQTARFTMKNNQGQAEALRTVRPFWCRCFSVPAPRRAMNTYLKEHSVDWEP